MVAVMALEQWTAKRPALLPGSGILRLPFVSGFPPCTSRLWSVASSSLGASPSQLPSFFLNGTRQGTLAAQLQEQRSQAVDVAGRLPHSVYPGSRSPTGGIQAP